MTGFLDLRARCSKVRSGLDLTRDWLIPNKDDLTFYNFNTHSAHSTPTKVHIQGLLILIVSAVPRTSV